MKKVKNKSNKIIVLLFFSLFLFSLINNRVLVIKTLAIDNSVQTQNKVGIKNQSDDKETWLNKIKKRIFGESTNKGSVLSVNEMPHDKTIRKYTEGKVLIKYKKNKINLGTKSGASAAVNLANSKSLEKEQNLNSENVSVLKIKDGKTVEEKIAELKNDPNIEFIQPNYQYEATVISSNDTYKGDLWGLDNTGQTVNDIIGTPDADIDIPEAWSISEGSTMVVVAVIDNGVGYSHPDLTVNMWDGSNCIGDGTTAPIDGGCPNHGYNFMDASNYGSYSSNFSDIDPLDPNQDFILPSPNPNTGNHWAPHGTHVAGTIAAVKNNSIGVIGVAPQTKIMALKTYYYTNEIVRSINFAKNNGVKIINASFGGYNWDDCSMYDAIKNFNGLFIISAMNDSYDVDSGDPDKIAYPAGFGLKSKCGEGLDNIIVVAATTNNDGLASFSNYGLKTVNIGAPGKDIVSVGIGESGQATYYFANGTSMAAPHVSGLAALLWGYNPNLTLHDVKAAILYNGESVPSLSGKTVTGKRINAQFTLQNARNYDTNKTITSFSINGIGVSGIINGTNIGITVPSGTDITNIAPEISSNSINTTPIDPPSGQAQNFTSSVSYTVMAEDTSTQNYTVVISATGSTITPIPVPSAPTNLTGTPGSNQVTLNWDAPVDVGSTILNYQIDYGIGDSWVTFTHESPITAPSVVVNGLTNGINYNFRVSAINQTGVGSTSSSITIRIGSDNKTITGFSFSGIGVSGIINGTDIGITVPYSTDVTNLTPTITINGASVSPLSDVAQNFTNPVTYTVTAEDTSIQNYIVTVSVGPVPVPSAPINLVAAPGNSQVLLSWTGPTDVGSSIVQYQVGYKESAISDTEINWTTQVIATSEINVSNISVTGLTNGTSYDFRVAAVNQTGPGAYVRSNGVIPMAPIPVPSAPTNLTGTPGSNQVTLSWDAPVDIGSSILDYKIEYGIGDSWVTFTHESQITVPPTVVNGLTNGINYNFRVSAINQTGVGSTSSSITIRIGSDNKTITGFSFSGIGVSGIINGTDIGITVPYSTDVTNLTPTITINGASVSPLSDVAQNFTNPVTYTVTAEDTSIQNYIVTVSVGPVPVPSAPINLVAAPGDSQVLLSWTGPTDVGSSIIDYQIDYGIGDSWVTVGHGSSLTETFTTVTDLTNGASYNFRVAAINQTGLGVYASINGVTPVANFTNLNIAITLAQSWHNSAVAGTDYGQYPTDAITDLQTAITTATGIKNNLTSNQDQIDLAVNALNNAVSTFRATKIVPSNIGATNLSDLVVYGTFTTTPSGDNSGEISRISVTNNITVNIGENVAKDTVYLPQGTDITEHDNQSYDASELSARIVDVSTLSNLDSGFVKEAAIQWGIPDKTLVFSNPITITVYVGTDLNGRTLNILRSPNGSSGWTNEGIVSPATCVVSSGYCQFLATKASYFMAASYEASTQQNSNDNNNNNIGPKVCTDTPPTDNPDLFEVKTTKGSVKLFYTPTSQATSYAILYGLKKGDERFGTFTNTINENKGVQNIDINMLNPKITYYFKVAAVNGCTMGPWSEWVPAKANRKSTIYKYKTIIKNKLKTLVSLFK